MTHLDIPSIFKNVYYQFKQSLSSHEKKTWFDDLAYDKNDQWVIFLKTSSELKKEKINKNYLKQIETPLKSYHPKLSLKIITNNEPSTPPPSPLLPSPSPQNPSTSPFSSSLPPSHQNTSLKKDHVFNRFVITKVNKVAYDFAQKIIQKIGIITPLYLYGPIGTGKTHLIQAIGNYYQTHFPFLKVSYINPNEFVSEFTKAISLGTDRDFRIKYKSLDVLLIDDIQFFIGKEKSCLEFFHIFNTIASSKKQMVFCSDREPSDLQSIDERLKSRLSSSAIIEIKLCDTEDKKKIIRFIARENQLLLSETILSFLAENLPSDIRKIIGAINTLSVFKDIYQEDITEDFCLSNIKQLYNKNQKKKYSPERLILATANYANISLSQLKSKVRSRYISRYRQISMYLLREYTNLSITEIGNHLGGKTPSAVSIAWSKMKKEFKIDSPLEKTIQNILSKT